MNLEEFRHHAHQAVDFMADFLGDIEQYPVKSQAKPREIYDQLPASPPAQPEDMEAIMADFTQHILPGMTHWQSPNFFAYFPGNSSYPSVIAEMLTATLAAQCMIWDTSPAAAELEELCMNWLKEMCALPAEWEGVIQDTASSATLCAILSAREQASEFAVNKAGFEGFTDFRVYCSTETHSSIDKAVKIAGIGAANLVKVAVDDEMGMDPAALEAAIQADLQAGKRPLCVIATLGTTSTTAFDPLEPIGQICQQHGLWLHVDAAFAGTAMILPEQRWMGQGIELADSYVFNPHKWMFTNFDCTAYFVKDKEALIRTFSILPEYLKTSSRGQVNDYRDWGIALGRRFRALKLWFVIRSFGVEGIQARLRDHLSYAQWLVEQVEAHPHAMLMAPTKLNLVCFRFCPEYLSLLEQDALNEKILHQLNDSGKLYLTHTKVKGRYTLRMVIGQTYVEKRHVEAAWEEIKGGV